MIDTVAAACRALQREPGYNDFWVVSALPDYSYEEGDRNSSFARVLRSYRDEGMEPELLDRAALGINGNLQEVLQRPEFGLGEVRRNKGKGQDLEFGTARAEVKLLFDGTLKSYYEIVAWDWEKLKKVRATGDAGQLFLIVYFVQLPNRTYSNSPRQTVFAGISEQYRHLRKVHPVDPTWPQDRPQPHPLSVPEGQVCRAVERRFDRIARIPAWFNIEAQLEGSALAVCVWEYPEN